MTTLEPTCLLTTKEAAEFCRRSPITIRRWVQKGWIKPYSYDTQGRDLFLDADLIAVDNHARGVAA